MNEKQLEDFVAEQFCYRLVLNYIWILVIMVYAEKHQAWCGKNLLSCVRTNKQHHTLDQTKPHENKNGSDCMDVFIKQIEYFILVIDSKSIILICVENFSRVQKMNL